MQENKKYTLIFDNGKPWETKATDATIKKELREFYLQNKDSDHPYDVTILDEQGNDLSETEAMLLMTAGIMQECESSEKTQICCDKRERVLFEGQLEFAKDHVIYCTKCARDEVSEEQSTNNTTYEPGKEYISWVEAELSDWRDTFEDDKDEDGEETDAWEKIDALINRFKNGSCSKDDYEEILFHLWQISFGKEEKEV